MSEAVCSDGSGGARSRSRPGSMVRPGYRDRSRAPIGSGRDGGRAGGRRRTRVAGPAVDGMAASRGRRRRCVVRCMFRGDRSRITSVRQTEGGDDDAHDKGTVRSSNRDGSRDPGGRGRRRGADHGVGVGSVDVMHGSEKVTIMRNQDQENTVNPAFAKTSRNMPAVLHSALEAGPRDRDHRRGGGHPVREEQ